jgi:hypothetical protein
MPSYLMNAQLPSFSPQFFHFFFQPEDHFCPSKPNSPSASYQLPTVATSSRITQQLPTTYTQATPSRHLSVSPRIITVRRLVNTSSATQGFTASLVREPFHCIPQGFQSRGTYHRIATRLQMTATVVSHQERMPSYGSSLDMDSVHTPARYIAMLSIHYRGWL